MSRARENADGARLDAPLASPAFTGTPTGITGTHITSGTLGNTVQDNITRLGTVTAGNLSNTAIVMPRFKEFDFFKVYSNEQTTTSNLTDLNISDTSYLEVTPESTADIIEFGYDFSYYWSNGYLGWGIERATDTDFDDNRASIWRNGEHTVGPYSSGVPPYGSHGGVVTQTASTFGMAAGTTYYCRMIGMTHNGTTNIYFGTVGSNNTHEGVKLTMKRWSIE